VVVHCNTSLLENRRKRRNSKYKDRVNCPEPVGSHLGNICATLETIYATRIARRRDANPKTKAMTYANETLRVFASG